VSGPGYWGKFPAATTQAISGYPVMRDSIAVMTGWNMIGSISCTVDTGTVVSIPAGLRGSNWFAYGASGYAIADQILPGHGYWVKATGIGHFVLSCAPPEKNSSDQNSALSDILNSLTIADAQGNSQTLYFGCDAKGEFTGMNFDLPPAPPAGAFDARFETAEGGSLVRIHPPDISRPLELPINVAVESYPLTIRWNMVKGTGTYYVIEGTGSIAHDLHGAGSLTLRSNSLQRIFLRLVGDDQVPAHFLLDQNYPNPFNPSTVIRYGLPLDSKVSIEVFNVLGQRVRVLFHGEQSASYHLATWDATDDRSAGVAAGVYFVRMAAIGANGKVFSAVRKLLLLQ
jgi:hypothetical protein